MERPAAPIHAGLSFARRLELQQEGDGYPVLAVAKIRSPARNNRTRGTGVSSRRCHASRSGEVGNIRGAMVVLEAVGEVLARHVICRNRSVPRLERIARILGEVRRPRGRCRSIDRRQQYKISARVVDLSATKSQSVTIVIEPDAVVSHEAEEALFRSGLAVAEATDTAPALATSVSGERGGRLADK